MILGSTICTLVLHEDQVPDLDVAILIRDGTALDTVGRASVVVDLRARTSRSALAGGPVVVAHAALLNALSWDRGLLEPVADCFFVVLVDSCPESLWIKSQTTIFNLVGQKLPGECDGFFLEVIPKRKVSIHLEEGAVASGLANLVDV